MKKISEYFDEFLQTKMIDKKVEFASYKDLHEDFKKFLENTKFWNLSYDNFYHNAVIQLLKNDFGWERRKIKNNLVRNYIGVDGEQKTFITITTFYQFLKYN